MTRSESPTGRLRRWQSQARRTGIMRRALWCWFVGDHPLPSNVAALATADGDGNPSVRMVLIKQVDEAGLRFFTHCASRKAKELTINPSASLLFYWPRHARQVRVEGEVHELDPKATSAYWKTRPRGSQLGAWASTQSAELSREGLLEERLAEQRSRFRGQDVPCPPFWGGYCLVPHRFEFWTGRVNRLHDRECYERLGGAWRRYSLMP